MSSNLGSENSGKFLKVDTDGSVVYDNPNVDPADIANAVEDYIENGDSYLAQTKVWVETTYTPEDMTDGTYWGLVAGGNPLTTAPATRQSASGFEAYSTGVYLNAGDSISIETKGASNARGYAVYDGETKALLYDDENNPIIGVASGNTIGNPFVYTATKRVYVLWNNTIGTSYTNAKVVVRQLVDNAPRINNVPLAFGQNKTSAEMGMVSTDDLAERLDEEYKFTDGCFDGTDSRFKPQAYKTVRDQEIGTKFTWTPTPLSTGNYYAWFGLYLRKGDTITIYGKGASNGRNWYYIDAKTWIVLACSAAGNNTLTTPFVYTATQDVIFGGNIAEASNAQRDAWHVIVKHNYPTVTEELVKVKTQTESNTDRLDQLDDPTIKASKINNPAFHVKDVMTFSDGTNTYTSQPTYRILDIGNSFTQNATDYLPNIVSDLGVDVSNISYCRALRGGASYKTFYDGYMDRDSTHSISISKQFGGLTETFDGGSGVLDGENFRNCLDITKHVWDLIIIHQVSTYSGEYEDWEGNTAAGYLKELIRLLKYHQPQATIGFLMVHSAPSNDSDTTRRWGKIAESARFMQRDYGVDLVIPVGTAVQNIRQSSVAANATHQMTADNSHQAPGLSKYTSNLTYYEAVFGPIFKKSAWDCTYYPSAGTPEDQAYAGDYIDVTAENAILAKKAAFAALADMETLHNPDDFEFPYVAPSTNS